MSKPPDATELDVPVVYKRKRQKPKTPVEDDWSPDVRQFDIVHRSVVSMEQRSGADVTFAEGMTNIRSIKSWDRWQPGIRLTDIIEDEDGQVYNIRSRDNWKRRNEWAEMELVARDG